MDVNYKLPRQTFEGFLWEKRWWWGRREMEGKQKLWGLFSFDFRLIFPSLRYSSSLLRESCFMKNFWQCKQRCVPHAAMKKIAVLNDSPGCLPSFLPSPFHVPFVYFLTCRSVCSISTRLPSGDSLDFCRGPFTTRRKRERGIRVVYGAIRIGWRLLMNNSYTIRASLAKYVATDSSPKTQLLRSACKYV